MKRLLLIMAAFIFSSNLTLKSQNNTKYGTGALNSVTTGQNNSAFGYQASYNLTTEWNTTAIGFRSLYLSTTGYANTAIGASSLYNNSTGGYNTAVGFGSLYSNTTANYNTAFGFSALYSNTTGSNNTAFGPYALNNNINGNNNTANGYFSLYNNTSGSENTSIGNFTLISNTTGNNNTAAGTNALYRNVTGFWNTATGSYALYYNYSGTGNTAYGMKALYYNSLGAENTAIGAFSLFNNNDDFNTAIGESALYSNTSGNNNTATGYRALYNNTTGYRNTADGDLSLSNNTTGYFNTSVGPSSGNKVITYYNTISIGFNASATASNQARIGNSNITSIGGQVSWTSLSDGRFEKEIKHDVPGLAFINKLDPVSYIIDKNALDDFMKVPDSLRIKENIASVTQSGFIPQDVEKILNEMKISNFNGIDLPKNENDLYGIRYAEFVVPLVKAVQELSALDKEKDLKINSLEEKINQLQIVMLESGLVLNTSSVNQLQSELNQNNPNPFANSTEIKCFIPSNASSAMLMVFDMNGKHVKTINISERGDCSVKINALDLKGAGMYIYSLYIDNTEISTKRMVLSE